MLKIGDYAVCPGHGVGRIRDIKKRVCDGTEKPFYIVEVVSNGMTMMVPTDSEGGIRPLVNDRQVQEVYDLLKNHDVEITPSTWNRRYREYMAKIKTGTLKEIAEVMRELFLLKARKKGLSFGEKKMLEQCKNLVAEEISLLGGTEQKSIEEDIESCFN